MFDCSVSSLCGFWLPHKPLVACLTAPSLHFVDSGCLINREAIFEPRDIDTLMTPSRSSMARIVAHFIDLPLLESKVTSPGAPYEYFVDVLQRVKNHAPLQMGELTPRRCKELFFQNPKRSVSESARL